jgi:hypothetical protein
MIYLSLFGRIFNVIKSNVGNGKVVISSTRPCSSGRKGRMIMAQEEEEGVAGGGGGRGEGRGGRRREMHIRRRRRKEEGSRDLLYW